MQAALLEQFLFGSASAATDGFGKELNQAGDQSEVIIADNQRPAYFCIICNGLCLSFGTLLQSSPTQHMEHSVSHSESKHFQS